MMRTLLAAASLSLSLAACLDFDARYATQLERLDGGASGSDGGGADAGASDAGLPDAGRADAGPVFSSCDASLCELGYWTSGTVKQIDGLVASSATDVVAVGDEYTGVSGNGYKCELVTVLADGGMSGVELVTDANSCRRAAGRPDNFWTSNFSIAFHVRNGQPDIVSYDDCQGGSSGGWESVQPLNDTEALFAGYDLTLCRITSAGSKALVSVAPERTDSGYSLYAEGVYQTPTGEIYMASSDGTVRLPDAGLASPQFEFDGDYTGLNDMAGVGQNVWTVGYQGTVARLMPSGQFEAVFDAGVWLKSVAVVSATDVWVAGDGAAIWHFDGQGWQRISVPHLSSFSTVRAIAAGKAYLHLGGIRKYDTESFVLSFQRGR